MSSPFPGIDSDNDWTLVADVGASLSLSEKEESPQKVKEKRAVIEEKPSVDDRNSGSGATKFRSGWSSTPTVPQAQMFLPTSDPNETAVQKRQREEKEEAREAAMAAERERDEFAAQKEAARLKLEKFARDIKEAEEEEAAEAKRLASKKQAEIDIREAELAAQLEAVEKMQQTSLELAELKIVAMMDATGSNENNGLDEVEEGIVEQAAPAAVAVKQEEDKEGTEHQVTWWRRNKCRCTSLLLLLLIVGLAAGLSVGLNNDNDPAVAMDSSGDSLEVVVAPIPPIPLVVDRSCEYRKSQTIYVGVADNGVDNRMWGSASDFDGNNAVVVSHNRDGIGAVWTLNKDEGSGTWQGQTAFQTGEADHFGWDVAIRGDLIVIGAPAYEGRDVFHPSRDNYSWWGGRGAAIVLAKDSSGDWFIQATLLPKIAASDASFGSSVDISPCGDFIAVGAWHDRDNHGSVFIFSKNSSGSWTETQKLAPTFLRQSESEYFHGNYGESVAITETLLAVKSPFDYRDGLRGVVYLYKRGSDGKYEEFQRLSTPQGPEMSMVSGAGMVFLDDFLLVGSGSNEKVYVFKRTSLGGYQKTTELTASDASPDSIFGISIDGRGSEAIVRDCGDDSSYLFSFEGGVWKEKAKFEDEGCNAALSGNSIVAQSDEDFNTYGGRYGGPVSFYELACFEPV